MKREILTPGPCPDDPAQLSASQLDALIASLQQRRDALLAGRKAISESGAAARQIYGARRRRESWFDASLFSEPAWDMLLDLYASLEQGQRLTVSDVGIAACVPITTSLCWLNHMERLGLVMRVPDTQDRRRVWVELTDQGRAAMAGYLSGERGPRA